MKIIKLLIYNILSTLLLWVFVDNLIVELSLSKFVIVELLVLLSAKVYKTIVSYLYP